MKENKCVQGDLFPELGTAEAQPQKKVKTAKKQSEVDALKEELRKLKEANQANLAKIAELEKENEALKKKAEAFDDLMQSNSLFPIGVIAKNYGMSAKGLNQYLHQNGVQFQDGEVWKLYAKYQDKGYTRYSWYNYSEDLKGRPLSRAHMYWTPKGMSFIRELLIADGIIKD